MATPHAQDSKSLYDGTPKAKADAQTRLKQLRYRELDADYDRQSRRLARLVARLKRDIRSKIG